jgi:hypothetical protein
MLRDGFDQHPVFFDFPNFLAIAHKMQGDFDEASRWYERTCELTGRHPVFEGLLASTLRLAGRMPEVESILGRLHTAGDDPRLDGVARGSLAVAANDLETAVQHFNEAADQRLPIVFWYRRVMHDRELPADHPGVRALWTKLWPAELST